MTPARRPSSRRMRARTVRATALTLFALVLTARSAAADLWYEHYARAERALAAEEWSEAVEQLNEAIARKADSGARVRSYGMRVIAYFPYLELGIAYYQLGQLEAALQAFDTEERLGAIQDSEEARSTLDRYRRLVREAREKAAAEQRSKVETIVGRALAEARQLESEGRLDEAVEALGRGLAVDPENAAALDLMERLREAAARRFREEQAAERSDELRRKGRERLAAGALEEAATLLRQSLDIRPEEETRRLLSEVQAQLRQDVGADSGVLRDAVSEGIAAARRLETQGRFAEAMDRLQPVLAVAPDDPEAGALHERLLQRERERLEREQVADLLSTAESDLAGGRFEAALGSANHVLALDRENPSALQLVARAYREISSRLLGQARSQNIRPAIRFADRREERADGFRVQVVREPRFRLSGVAIDDTPVEIEFSGPGDQSLPGRTTVQQVGAYFLTEFELQPALAPGPSTFRLVATDAEGLSSSSEYTVLYLPPVHRTLWFRSLLLAVPLGALALALGWRARRRKRLRRRRFNPYIAGAPVLDDGMFFGRQRLVDRILQTVHNNSLLLHGERRIGKTTIQHQLKKRLEALDDPAWDFFPVYVDLQGIPQTRFFATLAEEVFQQLAEVLHGLTPLTDPGDPGSYGYRDLVADLRQVIASLQKRSRKRVKLVLLIDEVDELNDYDPRINQRLRSLFMKSFGESLVAVVSGVEIKKDWSREASPWYNFFEEVAVEPFRREDAEELVRVPIRGIFRLDTGVVERILELTDCRPYLIQKHCIALVNRLYEENRRTITLADVEAVGRPEPS